MKKTITNQGEQQFERLLKLYLTQRNTSLNESFAEHLDEDTLTAFAEGSLGKNYDLPVISHLTNCSTCRRSALELLRLGEQLNENSDAIITLPIELNRLYEFWNELKAKVFNSTDSAVYAYKETDEDKLNINSNKDQTIK